MHHISWRILGILHPELVPMTFFLTVLLRFLIYWCFIPASLSLADTCTHAHARSQPPVQNQTHHRSSQSASQVSEINGCDLRPIAAQWWDQGCYFQIKLMWVYQFIHPKGEARSVLVRVTEERLRFPWGSWNRWGRGGERVANNNNKKWQIVTNWLRLKKVFKSNNKYGRILNT